MRKTRYINRKSAPLVFAEKTLKALQKIYEAKKKVIKATFPVNLVPVIH